MRATYSKSYIAFPLSPHQSNQLIHEPEQCLSLKWPSHKTVQATSFQLFQKITTYCSHNRATSLLIYLLIKANKSFAQKQRTDLPDNGLRFLPADAVKTVAGAEPLKPSIVDKTNSRRMIFLAIGFSIAFSLFFICVVILIFISRRRKKKDKEILSRATWQVTPQQNNPEALPVTDVVEIVEEAPVPNSNLARLRDSTLTGQQRLLRQKESSSTSGPDSNSYFYFPSAKPEPQNSANQLGSEGSESIYARRARASWFVQTRHSKIPSSLPAPLPPSAAKLASDSSHSNPEASTSLPPLIHVTEAIPAPQSNLPATKLAPDSSHSNSGALTGLRHLPQVPEAINPLNSNPSAGKLAPPSSHLNGAVSTLFPPLPRASEARPPLKSNTPVAQIVPDSSHLNPSASTLLPHLLEVPELSPLNFNLPSRNSNIPPTHTSHNQSQ
ncbi:hypothetical protein DFH28DRAFT_1059452 [Melampsora americana]|nr:hypothetical protein DFH28DRAFT_1059452 [Melampsora americana]